MATSPDGRVPHKAVPVLSFVEWIVELNQFNAFEMPVIQKDSLTDSRRKLCVGGV